MKCAKCIEYVSLTLAAILTLLSTVFGFNQSILPDVLPELRVVISLCMLGVAFWV